MLAIFDSHPAIFALWFMFYAVILLVMAAICAEKTGKVKYAVAKSSFFGAAVFFVVLATHCVSVQNAVWPYY